MTRLGDGDYTQRKSPCPFCGAKGGKWAVFREANGRDFFKCHKPGCDANEPPNGHNEVGYLSLRKGLSQKDASLEYLRMAVPELLEAQEQEEQRQRASKKEEPAPSATDDSASAESSADDDIFGEASEPPPPRSRPLSNPWHTLWELIPLTKADREAMQKKRGFSDATIDALGFRSNSQSNQIHLEQLLDDYRLDQLVKLGLYTEDPRGRREPRPCSQFLGYGITNEKDANGDRVWAITNPPIIPYLDEHGIPFYLRPHKGGVSQPAEDEDDEAAEETCASEVYCPFLIADLMGQFDGTLVLTEGEFKAAALYQCGIPAIAVPGITFIRNRAYRKKLIELFTRFSVSNLVICFDNEQKDNPDLPNYQADPNKRYDAQIYAEYTAIDLREYFKAEGGTCKIAWLPRELMIKGKADFDGVLSGYVHGVADHGTYPREGLGLKYGTAKARAAFLKLIASAGEKPPLDLFPTESRRYIEFRLQQLFEKPLLLFGSFKEQKLVAKLAQSFPTLKDPTNGKTGRIVDEDLARDFRQINGCYYERKAIDAFERAQLKAELKVLDEQLSELGDKDRYKPEGLFARARKSAIFERFKGIPKPLSDFTMQCEFKLHNLGGEASYLVRIRNHLDNRKSANPKLYRLLPVNSSRLANFREWGYATGRAVWKGGDKELQLLMQDLSRSSYLRDIYEINTYGWHRESGLWFFGDSAFVSVEGEPTARRILADDNNIFWWQGIGYQIDTNAASRGTNFCQKAPILMAPTSGRATEKTLPALFEKFARDFFDTIGDFDAWAAIGIIIAYAAGPELIRHGGHPGLWLFGKMSGGKTTCARWLMRIWGFGELGGIRMNGTTSVGLNRNLMQYSSLPVWFDEYRAGEVDDDKRNVIRGAFDRSADHKGLADHTNRTRAAAALTTPLITGETSERDSATRSRFFHSQVSTHRRLGDGSKRYHEMQDDSHHFYSLGRYLMENRPAFIETMLGDLEAWKSNPKVRENIANERTRLTHGVAYTAFTTLAAMLGVKLELGSFFDFLMEDGRKALAEVIEETFLNTFWNDIIGGIQMNPGVFKKFIAKRHVTIRPDGSLEIQKAETSESIPVCYLSYTPVYNTYAEQKARRREDIALDRNSLTREMSKEPYFIPLPKRGGANCHRLKFEGTLQVCWVIRLDTDKTGRRFFPWAEEMESLLMPDAES